jgi:predicted CopG family antitoxin
MIKVKGIIPRQIIMGEMSPPSIEISDEAYRRLLSARKSEDEDLSGVILRKIPDPTRIADIIAETHPESEIARALQRIYRDREK